MGRVAAPLIEYVSESSVACLFTMVQGNPLALTASHLLIASQTGLIAGTIATVGVLVANTRNRWLISAGLGVTTGIADLYVHPGMYGSVAIEALATGLAAAFLSYMVGVAKQRIQADRDIVN